MMPALLPAAREVLPVWKEWKQQGGGGRSLASLLPQIHDLGRGLLDAVAMRDPDMHLVNLCEMLADMAAAMPQHATWPACKKVRPPELGGDGGRTAAAESLQNSDKLCVDMTVCAAQAGGHLLAAAVVLRQDVTASRGISRGQRPSPPVTVVATALLEAACGSGSGRRELRKALLPALGRLPALLKSGGGCTALSGLSALTAVLMNNVPVLLGMSVVQASKLNQGDAMQVFLG